MKKSLLLATALMLSLSLSAYANTVVIDVAAQVDSAKHYISHDLVKPDVYNIQADDVAVLLNPGISIPDGDAKHQLPAGVSAKSVTAVNRYEVPPHIGWNT